MSLTTVQAGYLPVNRGEYVASPETRYYKDNVVQYNGSSYIADPTDYDPTTNPEAYVTDAPYDDDPTSLNTGWRVFADAATYVENKVGEIGVFDISSHNLSSSPLAPTKYASLTAALGTNGANVPEIYQRGGMMVKFINSSTNKYEQYRLKATSFSTTESDWVNIEKEKETLETKVNGLIYDVSANNSGVVFASLSELLSSGNLSTLIPTSIRTGGMTIRFKQGASSSDNKYVEYFLTKNTWSASEADWKKVNLEEEVSQLGQKVNELEIIADGLPIMELGDISTSGADVSNSSYARTVGYIQGPFSIKLATGLKFGNICKFSKNGNTYTKIGNPGADTSLYIATNDDYYYRFAVNYNGQTISNPQYVIESATLKEVLNDVNVKAKTENTTEIVDASAPFSPSPISGGTLSDGRMSRSSLIGAITPTTGSKYTEFIPVVRGKEYQVKTYIHLMYDAGVAYYRTNIFSPENFCGLDNSFVGDGTTDQAVTKTGKLDIPEAANYFVVFSRDASLIEINELSPVAAATNSALNGKVDKVAGKGLSTNDFSNEDKVKLDSLQPGGVPEEIVRQAVDDYVEENSGGFVAQPNGLNLVTSNTYKLMPSVLGEPIALTTGWAGDLANGFTHASGNTDALEFSLSGYATGVKLLVTFDATGISSESEDVLISQGTSPGIKSYNGGTSFVAGFINDGTNLFVKPTSEFSGTITNLKVRKIDEDNGTETVTVTEDNIYTYRHDLVAGYWNIGIGSRYDVLSKLQDGTRNIAIGKKALDNIVFGNRNVAIGTFSSVFLTEGENNVSIGSDSLYPVTKSLECVAIGKATLTGKESQYCVAIGVGAMGDWNNSWTRAGCVAIGKSAGKAVISECTHIGYRAGANVSGEKNTSVGYNALGIGTRSTVDIVGTKLTCIGYNASVANNATAKEATNSTAIGANATITGSNQMVFGDSNVIEFILGGKRLVFNNDNTVSWETI